MNDLARRYVCFNVSEGNPQNRPTEPPQHGRRDCGSDELAYCSAVLSSATSLEIGGVKREE